MTNSAIGLGDKQKRRHEARAKRRLLLFLIATPLVGAFWATNLDCALGYCLISVTSGVPVAFWFQAGLPGVPIWPGVAFISWLYYALPILRDQYAQATYSPHEILFAAITVAIYLVLGTIVWMWIGLSSPARGRAGSFAPIPETQVRRIVLLGLSGGAIYYLLLFSGRLTFLGASLGVVRSAVTAICLVGCYLLGSGIGLSLLRGQTKSVAALLLGANVILCWSSLFLYTGITEIFASAAGYIISTKRLPWKALTCALALLIVLHAGKGEMREKYWAANTNWMDLNVVTIPALILEWFGTGLKDLASPEEQTMIVDRASLFSVLLNAEHLAPNYVPFLYGETYAFLPDMLVPRFLNEGKITTQEGMRLLNIHFGVQSEEATNVTAIGWGLIAEGFANFGLLGVAAIGLTTGLITGLLSRWSANGGPLSRGTLVGIVAMTIFINVEADFSNLVTTLAQSCFSVIALDFVRKSLQRGKNTNGRSLRQDSESRSIAERRARYFHAR